MKYKNVLLTGSSGKLGQAIIKSGYFPSLLTPSKEVLDITRKESIQKFFENNNFDAIIHCAAMARMKECEENPEKASEVNINGTNNLVLEAKNRTNMRFIHISTDGVYAGTKGNYSERDETVPYNTYGRTKLGAEAPVKTLANYCIIRTGFFDPNDIKFEDSAIDAFSSKIPINDLAKAISIMLDNEFVGIINIGGEKKSDYDHYKEFKPNLKKCKLKDILKTVTFSMAQDASMDCSLWNKIKK